VGCITRIDQGATVRRVTQAAKRAACLHARLVPLGCLGWGRASRMDARRLPNPSLDYHTQQGLAQRYTLHGVDRDAPVHSVACYGARGGEDVGGKGDGSKQHHSLPIFFILNTRAGERMYGCPMQAVRNQMCGVPRCTGGFRPQVENTRNESWDCFNARCWKVTD
jgi:hypothetical protein